FISRMPQHLRETFVRFCTERNLTVITPHSFTLLDIAIILDNINIVKMLIAGGSNINSQAKVLAKTLGNEKIIDLISAIQALDSQDDTEINPRGSQDEPEMERRGSQDEPEMERRGSQDEPEMEGR